MPRDDDHNHFPSPQRFGLPEPAIAAIQRVLARYPQVELAVLYGSRAIGRHRPASDIDLTLVGRDLDASTLAGIEADLDDLLLPWMIDLSSFSDLNHPPLLVHIERVGQVFYRRGELIQGRP
jgi:predicted nucleotidyltransferase